MTTRNHLIAMLRVLIRRNESDIARLQAETERLRERLRREEARADTA